MLQIKGKYTTANVMIDEIESTCLSQIHEFVNHPAFDGYIAIMPDTHAGKGSVIGFTMLLGNMLIPNTIGVDIGCGVLSFNIGNTLNKSLEEIDEKIRATIPMGTNVHEYSVVNFKKQFPYEKANKVAQDFVLLYNKKFGTDFKSFEYTHEWFLDKTEIIGCKARRAIGGIGTLGGGNHFIEVGRSSTYDDYWVTIHSGSRNFGKCICDYHQNIAKKDLDNKRNKLLKEKIDIIVKNTQDKSQINVLIDEAKKELGLDFGIDIKGLEALSGQKAMDYFLDMIFAQIYAEFNRNTMRDIILGLLNAKPQDEIHCVHNYIDFHDMIIRKGAIACYAGERQIIPFNMRDGMLITEGKSNADWNFSGPHGAGRLMSRSKANSSIDIKDFKKQMEGIYSTSVCESTLDESPGAYKDSKTIELAIEPTARVLDRIKPVLNIKDKGEKPKWK